MDRESSLALSILYLPPRLSALGLRGDTWSCGWDVNLKGEGFVLSDMSQAALDSALPEAMFLILVEREERLGRPRPRESH